MISISRQRLESGLVLTLGGRLVFFHPELSRLAIFHNDPDQTGVPDPETLRRWFHEAFGKPGAAQPGAAQPGASQTNEFAVREYWKQARHAVSALNLNLTDKCNLACIYCYARGGNYQRLHQELSPEAAVNGVAAAFAQADPQRDFRIEFFGGEPFLNPAAIQAVLDWQSGDLTWINHPHGTRNRVSTNLTELSESLLQDIRRSKMILSVSIDGSGTIQDEQRPFKDGSGSSRIIFDHLRQVREACPDHTIVARMTVYHHADKLRHTLEELVATDLFDYASIYPAAVHSDKTRDVGDSYFSRDFQQEFLAIAADYPRFVGRGRFKGILELNRYCQLLLEGRAAANHCRAGSGYFTLSPDGSIHPCHRLVGDLSWNLGTFALGTPEHLARLRPWHTTIFERPACAACALRYLCGGGCKQENLLASGSLIGTSPRVCAFSHLLFDAAVSVCANLTPVIIPPLRQAFRESEGLFVLCGQPLVHSPRPPVPSETPGRKNSDRPRCIFPEGMFLS